MNVVIINDNGHVTGGADKIALTSAVELAKRGDQVYLLTAVAPVAPELQGLPNLQVICTNQYEILRDPSRLRAATQGLWNMKSADVAANLFRQLSPETTVVHLHLWAKALSSSVVRAAVDRGLSVVCTLHDYLLACPNGTFFDHSAQSICTRRPLGTACALAQCDSRGYGDKLWRLVRGTVQGSFGRLPSGLTDVVSISDLVLSVMRPYLPKEITLHRLSNFVEVEQTAPADVAGASAFTFLGRLVTEKGPQLFARAAALAGVEAVFLGEGDARSAIMAALPTAYVSGWLTPADAFAALRRSRAMIFPSLWYEAQPLVVLEALANGVPCVVADTSAARELVTDGVTGLHFRGGDASSLQEKLVALKDPSLAASLGRNAYDTYWAAPRTLQSHVNGLQEIYQGMLCRRAGKEVLC